MPKIEFEEFFKKATGFKPYPYQERLANGKNIPDILSIPTGAGKTEAAIIAIYLWRRIHSNQDTVRNTPRRLVYCLPMRVLVEQTVSRVTKWIKNLELEDCIDVITVMGGNTNSEYRLEPEKELIVIGTQDMLLSRALNRGYGMSQFQWPVEFGLLNNDCLWIMDEIQLMHNGLATSVQLEGFRNKMETYGPHKTVWMSATLNPQWLKTVDFDPQKCTIFTMNDKDTENKLLSKRNTAKKQLKELELADHEDEYTKNDAIEIKKKHEKGTITLIITNTVKRAQSLFDELNKIPDKPEIMLIHSRFRSGDRIKLNKKIQDIIEKPNSEQDIIIVSTQVVEAGIDISAKTLITEISPWSSMVQRFGRCNRKGEYDDSKIYFINLVKDRYYPYDKAEIKGSEEKIKELLNKSVSPKNIPENKESIIHEIVIREPDLLGLFDTVHDLSGNHTDVSRYVRSLEDTKDVSVVWREFDEEDIKINQIRNDEVCNIPIQDMKKFKKGKEIWSYDRMIGSWTMVDDVVYPGQTYLIHSKYGGYTEEKGWHEKLKDTVKSMEINSEELELESMKSDTLSGNSNWITLNDHTYHVVEETKKIVEKLKHLEDYKDILKTVAKYHDIGKAHKVFQNTMVRGTDEKIISRNVIWAKRGGRAYHERENFRHEAASALAFLKLDVNTEVDLAAYLIASHHGRMRLSMRSLPERKNRGFINPTEKYILGIKLGETENLDIFLSDKIKKSKNNKEIRLKESVVKSVEIDASIAKIGQNGNNRSWLQITLGLLKKHGPFRLAYLEAIVRAADSKASKKEREDRVRK